MDLHICVLFTRAVHLELVTNYSPKAFIAALGRFVSWRGKPAKIISDSGTNFVGADRELKNVYNEIIKSDEWRGHLSDSLIEW